MNSPSNAAAVTAPQRALAAYRRRNRRLMRGYALILAALLIAVLALVKLAYSHGELTKVSRRSATAPPIIAPLATRAALSQKWRTSDQPATGSAYAEGIVVTFSGATVNGRDAQTGAVRWFYTRRDQTVCAVVQQSASTIAIYRRGNNCDEVTGFETATGVPKFYRTLQDNGTPAVTSAPNVVLVATPAAVHVFDNAGGIDRWRWLAPDGCQADRSLVGSLGVLVSYHCGTAQHLMLHSLTQKDEIWNISVPLALVPFDADAVTAALNPATGAVTVYSTDKGVRTGAFTLGQAESAQNRARLTAVPAASTGIALSTAAVASNSLVLAGTVIAVGAPGRVLWTSQLTGAPALLSDNTAAVIEAGRVSQLSTSTGKQLRTIALTPALPSAESSATVSQIGDGLLVTGTDTAFYD